MRNGSRIKWFGGVGEYRIDWGPGYRIYLAQDGNDLIILFSGGTKKKQQTDIDEAMTLFLNGEPDVARLLLRDLVNATVGFETLASETTKTSMDRLKCSTRSILLFLFMQNH